MKYIIAVDCEGVACAVGEAGHLLTTSPDYNFACRQAVREANAAARALFEGGAGEVIVWDNHGGSLNLPYEDIDERCDILLGTRFERRFAPLDENFSGVLFIGYHSMDNVIDAPLAHTFDSTAYQWIRINEREVGELAIDAAVAGTCGVPPLFVASDDKAVAEAKRFFPGISTVTTKKGFGCSAALSKHPKRVEREIHEAVALMLDNPKKPDPFSFSGPLKVEIRFKRVDETDLISRSKSGWLRTDAYTVLRTVDSITDLY